jgi:hypothetical protein
MTVATVNMDFLYGGAFRTGLPEAYERLILDAMRGDPTLFTRADEIEEQWRIVDSFRHALGRPGAGLSELRRGDVGTDEATSSCTATADPGGGIERGQRPGVDGPRRHDRADRARARAAPERFDGHAHERDDAHRLGAAGVAGRRAGHARRNGRAASLRTLLLFPQDDERDALDAEVSLQCYTHAELQRHVCTEVIELRLCGRVAQAPASVILPLVLPDVPVFLRWRGEPPFGEPVFEQLIDVVDRLVVDSREWEGAPACYAKLVEIFDRVAVSDIVWARTLRWRRAIAERGGGRQLRVRGPIQESSLLAGWLRSRLGHPVELEHTDADRIELAVLDGEEIRAREERPSASDLLSGELDRFSRRPRSTSLPSRQRSSSRRREYASAVEARDAF